MYSQEAKLLARQPGTCLPNSLPASAGTLLYSNLHKSIDHYLNKQVFFAMFFFREQSTSVPLAGSLEGVVCILKSLNGSQSAPDLSTAFSLPYLLNPFLRIDTFTQGPFHWA